MKVIGAGFGRTGTKSVKYALEQLGFGPCYHMMEVFKHSEHIPLWHKAAFGEDIEWDDILGDYASGVDWPVCYFWKSLARRYPTAKILLTIRPATDWYTSMENTIFSRLINNRPQDDIQKMWLEMVNKMTRTDTFHNRTGDRAYCEAVFERHNEYVKQVVPADRLIIYTLGSGWDPLCGALNVPVPDRPFPRINSTEDFRRKAKDGDLKPQN